MDPLTHGILGALTAKTLRSNRRRSIMLILMSFLPDIDVIFSWSGPWSSMIQHRGITHSILGLCCQSLGYAWLCRRFDRGLYLERARDYSLALALHVLCDALTIYGVPLFLPLSRREYSLDLIGAWPWIPALFTCGILIFISFSSSRSKHLTRSAWIFWGIYLGLSVGLKVQATKFFSGQRPLTALPDSSRLWVWGCVERDEKKHEYVRHDVNLLNHNVKEYEPIPMPVFEGPVLASAKSKMVGEFLETNRWPTAHAQQNVDGWSIDWGTLIYSMKGFVREKVRVVIGEQGEIKHEQRIFGFWNGR